jgi:cell division protein FtsB
VPVIVLGLVALLGWTLYPALKLQYQESRRQAGLQQQYDSLRQRNEALRAQVAELKTPAGVEKAAREDLGYAKSGEHVYIVMPSASSTAGTGPTATSSASAASGSSVIRTLLDVIFGVEEPSSDVEP